MHKVEFIGENANGLIKVVFSGNQEPRSVQISNDAQNIGAEAISALVTQAMKDAYEKSTANAREQMEKLTERLKL